MPNVIKNLGATVISILAVLFLLQLTLPYQKTGEPKRSTEQNNNQATSTTTKLKDDQKNDGETEKKTGQTDAEETKKEKTETKKPQLQSVDSSLEKSPTEPPKNPEGKQEQTETQTAADSEKTENSETTPPTNSGQPLSATATSSPINWTEINRRTREAVVNIICTSEQSGYFAPLSGSGVIIDKRGIILTNAHIGQYFLIKDYSAENFLNCFIRVGSPAKSKYRAKLVYLSPRWIENNYQKLLEEKTVGHGEEDYAFLSIVKTTDGSILPTVFPFLEIDASDRNIRRDYNVILASYPAGFLGGILTQNELSLVSSIGRVAELFTFKEKTLDAFSVEGNLLSQEGSSGGAIVGEQGKLLGIIAAATTEPPKTSERKLIAATLFHIDKSLLEQNGFSLGTFLSDNLEAAEKKFTEEIAPRLQKLLITTIQK